MGVREIPPTDGLSWMVAREMSGENAFPEIELFDAFGVKGLGCGFRVAGFGVWC